MKKPNRLFKDNNSHQLPVTAIYNITFPLQGTAKLEPIPADSEHKIDRAQSRTAIYTCIYGSQLSWEETHAW